MTIRLRGHQGHLSTTLIGLRGRRRRRRGGRAVRRGGGRARTRIGLLVGLFGVVLVGAGVGGRRRLAVALGRAVIGVVEAGALEVHGHWVEYALYGGSADLALGHGTVGHLLHHVEVMAVLAAVLVNGHGERASLASDRGSPRGARPKWSP